MKEAAIDLKSYTVSWIFLNHSADPMSWTFKLKGPFQEHQILIFRFTKFLLAYTLQSENNLNRRRSMQKYSPWVHSKCTKVIKLFNWLHRQLLNCSLRAKEVAIHPKSCTVSWIFLNRSADQKCLRLESKGPIQQHQILNSFGSPNLDLPILCNLGTKSFCKKM